MFTEVQSASFTLSEAPEAITMSSGAWGVSSHRGLLDSRHIVYTEGVATHMIASCARVCGKDTKGIPAVHGCLDWTGLVAQNTKNAFWGKSRFYFVQDLQLKVKPVTEEQ